MDGLLKYLAEFGAPRSEETISKLATGNPLMLAKAARNRAEVRRAQISDLMNYPQDWSQFGQNLAQAYPTSSPEAVRQAAYQAAVNAGPLATVYHGSPHRFDKFDSSKIGTGEGAQAYGHGLYFAETPDVAKTYAPRDFAREEKLMKFYKEAERARNYEGMEVLEAALLHESPSEIVRRFSDKSSGYSQKHATEAKRVSDWMNKNPSTMGGLYKVDLPDDQIAKMLDWDKPLSQQPHLPKKILDEFRARQSDGYVPQEMRGDTGAALLAFMRTKAYESGSASNYADEAVKAAQMLREAGIPGIRYLDGGSRAGGQGTSNFVVFPGNEGILKILGRE